MPFGKDSYKSAETLGYLNSQQALADFAILIWSLKQNLPYEASPIVVFGGSYIYIYMEEVISSNFPRLETKKKKKNGSDFPTWLWMILFITNFILIKVK